MATTRMEINMRDGSVTMMVLGKKLRLDVFNSKSPPLYSSNDANYCFDEDFMKHVRGSIRTLHFDVQGRSKKGGQIWVPKEKPWHPGDRSFSTNFLHILSSDFDDTGTLKSNGEKLEKSLTLGDGRKTKFLRKSDYEEEVDGNPNFRRSPRPAVDPNDAEKDKDQQGKSPP